MVRDTSQREAIRKTLVNAGRPLSVNEIYEQARHKAAGLGIATVYRNIKALQSEKYIVQVQLPGQSPRWELAPESHHHHFLCRTCNKMFKINDCPEGLMHILPEGYTLEEHDILLRGLCDKCTRVNRAHIDREEDRNS